MYEDNIRNNEKVNLKKQRLEFEVDKNKWYLLSNIEKGHLCSKSTGIGLKHKGEVIYWQGRKHNTGLHEDSVCYLNFIMH